MSKQFEKVIASIDQFNGQDPRLETYEGRQMPLELAYSLRLSEWVSRLWPEAPESVKIAARGQHVGRWLIPRDRYPLTRGGYLRWREDLKKFHSDKVGAFMAEQDYRPEDIERVRSIILKKQLQMDPEAQTIEDALCLVFLETQLADLMKKTEREKMKDIIRKTWRKMTARGKEWALRLPLAPAEQKLIEDALNPDAGAAVQ